MLTFDNENWSRSIDREKETRSRIVGDTWNSGISSFCTWLNTSTNIVHESIPFSVACIPSHPKSSSLPRRRDFLSREGKHADHKRRFRKNRHHCCRCFFGASRCELYIQQTLCNHAPSCSRSPAFPKFARRGRSYVSCLLSAQFELTSSSGVLRRALHRFDEISRGMASLLTTNNMERRIAKRLCYWTGNGTEGKKKKWRKAMGEGRNLLPRFARL